MAEYRFSASIVSRGKGQSAIAKAAYNAREKIVDERTGQAKDYSRKDGLEFSGIFAPKDAPEWAKDRAALWNAVELREDQQPNKKNRAEAQLARSIELSLPHELNADQRKQLVRDFVREQFQRKGMVADVAIHAPSKDGDQRNYHAHILVTMRELGPDGFGGKVRDWNSKELNSQWREKWAELGARYLAKAGFELEAERYKVGHLTLDRQRQAAIERGDLAHADALDRKPTKHLGPHVAAMESKGIETERGNIYRDTMDRNATLAALKADLAAVEKQIAAERIKQPTTWERREAHLAGLNAQVDLHKDFRGSAQAATERIAAPEGLSNTSAAIWKAYQRSDNARGFVAALEDSGMKLAKITKEEARASEIDSHYAKQAGKFAATYREGEIVVVSDRSNVFRLTPRSTGAEWRDIKKLTRALDPKTLQSLTSAKQSVERNAASRDIERQAFRDVSGVGVLGREKDTRPTGRLAFDAAGKDQSSQPVKTQAKQAVSKGLEAATAMLGGAIEKLGDAFGATAMTPERLQAAADAREAAAAQDEIDWERFRTDKNYHDFVERREAQKLEAERQREDYERQRDGPQR